MTVRWAAVAVVLAMGTACADGGNGSPVGNGSFASATIGPDGGTILLEGATLEVPPGALETEIGVRLTSTIDEPPSGFRSYSPVYGMTPSGQVLKVPATFRVPFEDAPAQPALILSSADGTGWAVAPGTAADGVLTVPLPRLGRVFVVDRAVLSPGQAQ